MDLNINYERATKIQTFFGNSLFMLIASDRITKEVAELTQRVMAHPEIDGIKLMNDLTLDQHELERFMCELQSQEVQDYNCFFAKITAYIRTRRNKPKVVIDRTVDAKRLTWKEKYEKFLGPLH
jgi:hypothetical protein